MRYAEQRRLLSLYDKPGPRYTSYPTAVHFSPHFTEHDYRRSLALANREDAPLSVYVHLPFCQQRCLFCACTTIVSPQKAKVVSYLDDLAREIDVVAAQLPDRRTVHQLHLGGGTPTYFSPPELDNLMLHLRHRFSLPAEAELSAEVDPRVTSDEHLEVLARQGFGRLSLGVQDLDIRVQRAVNRVQPVRQTLHVIARARELGMTSINIDLIFGLPHQTVASFGQTIDKVIAMNPGRLAIYGFAYVPWMRGHQKKLPLDSLPDREQRFDLQAMARYKLRAAGYLDIGMDHYALPNDGLARAQEEGRLWRNFMGYTTCRAPDMLGFGLSAIGFVRGAYIQNTAKLSRYRSVLAEGRLPVEKGHSLGTDDRIRQQIIRELMCHFQIDRHAITDTFGIDFDTYFADELAQLAPEKDAGLLTDDGSVLRATESGRLFVRNLAMAFDSHLRNTPRSTPTYSRTV